MKGHAVPLGFSFSGIRCGIKRKGLDLGLILANRPCAAAAVFTTNRMAAVSVAVNRGQVAAGSVRALLVNAGCANACSGPAGAKAHRAVVASFAKEAHLPAREVYLSSTGVIGPVLPVETIVPALPGLLRKASPSGLPDFVRAIMTTDTTQKVASREVCLAGKSWRVLGVAKGAGMIEPNMATMLAFVVTDAPVTAAYLGSTIRRHLPGTFNAVTVDGDTSTNDSLFCLASGAAGGTLTAGAKVALSAAFGEVFLDLAEMIAADGEGATKLVKIEVSGAPTRGVAATVAKGIANSLLVKTALFGGDPNWGRIASAVGASWSGVTPAKVTIAVGGVTVFAKGAPTTAGIDKPSLHPIFTASTVPITVDLGQGKARASVLTCALSRDYVTINADYHT
jgi:glutamate N-acetyltransferase/amino-acid N-acetyltransferase